MRPPYRICGEKQFLLFYRIEAQKAIDKMQIGAKETGDFLLFKEANFCFQME